MNISDVAKKTGLTSKAIRFYEEKGLVTPPLRSENGYRTYSQQHLDELTLLRQARQGGVNLEECRELVALFNDPSRHSADVKKRTLEKVADIENHIRELQNMRAHLLAPWPGSPLGTGPPWCRSRRCGCWWKTAASRGWRPPGGSTAPRR